MSNTALLVMDVQQGIVDRIAADPEYVPRLRTAVDAAHEAGIPVIYVVLAFRPGYPEISRRNQRFSQLSQSGAFSEGGTTAEIHPGIAPQPGDVVVTKKRVSAFTGSDLDVVLRSGGIDNLVLSGIATSGVVLSTLRQAADLDFGLTVLTDGCADADPEVHRVLTEKVFPRQASVGGIEEWIKTIRG